MRQSNVFLLFSEVDGVDRLVIERWGEGEVVVRCGRCGFSFSVKEDPLEVDERGVFREVRCPRCKVLLTVFGGEGDGDC